MIPKVRLDMRLIAALMLAGLATAGASKDPLAGRTAGTPVACLTDFNVTGPTVVDRNTILYNAGSRRTWVVHPQGSCPALRPFTTLIVEKWGSQSCAGDRFRVLDPGTTIPSPYCRFGKFVPYDKPPRPKR